MACHFFNFHRPKFHWLAFVFLFLSYDSLEAAAPDAFTSTANRITFSGAHLHALVNPNALTTTITFEYGLTASYGKTLTLSSKPNGSSPVFITGQVIGLEAGKRYHYRVKAVNADGTSFGTDRIFITGSSFATAGMGNFSVYVDETGNVYSVGNNANGELGDSSTAQKTAPIRVLKGAYKGSKYLGDNTSNPIISVSSGWDHCLALAADGTVFSFGSNSSGQLGNNGSTDQWLPTQVLKGDYTGTKFLGDNPNNPIVSIDAGAWHSLALAADGTVYSFGDGVYAQLGDASNTSKSTPVRVKAGAYSGKYLGDNPSNPMVAISAGGFTNLSLAADGTVYAWGNNAYGQCGDSTMIERISPVQVNKGDYKGTKYFGDQAKNPAVSIYAGCFHCSILSLEGKVYHFGRNLEGQLGDNTTKNHWEPTLAVKGEYSGTTFLGDKTGNPIISISGGKYFNLALASDGTLYGYGDNSNGGLGDSTFGDRHAPVKMKKASNAGTQYIGDEPNYPMIAMAGGQIHSLIMAADGIVFAVGHNGNGDLGDNSTTNRTMPVNTAGIGSLRFMDLISTLPKGFLGDDIKVCGVDSVKIGSSVKFNSYLWNTGATKSTIYVKSTGNYILSGVTPNGEIAQDTLFVSVVNGRIYPRDSVTCNGAAITIKLREAGTPTSNKKYPLKYSWSTKDTTKTLTVSKPGRTKFSVTVSNGYSQCKDSSTATVNRADFHFSKDTFQVTSCNKDSLRFSVDKKYKFRLWSTGQGDSVVYLSKSGTYFVKVKDSVGCFASDTFVIQNPGKMQIQTDSIYPVKCFGEATGQIFTHVTGSYGPYQLAWNDANFQTTAYATNLAAGKYTLFVTDKYGCKDSMNEEILSPSKINLSIQSIDSVQCFGGNDGGAKGKIFGGTFPYRYQWSDQKKQTQLYAVGLTEGQYAMKVLDANGCKDSIQVQIPQPKRLLTVNQSDTTACYGSWITLTASGARTYTWKNLSFQANIISGTPFQLLSNASEAKFVVFGKNYKGCIDSARLSVHVIPRPHLDSITGPTAKISPQTPYHYVASFSPVNSIHWTVLNGNLMSGQGTKEVVIEWIKDGTGEVWAEISNPQGCKDSLFVDVKIGGVGLDQTRQMQRFQLFPNPSFDKISVKFSSQMAQELLSSDPNQQNNLEYSIWDSKGELMQKGILEKNNEAINIRNLPAGVYQCRIQSYALPFVKSMSE